MKRALLVIDVQNEYFGGRMPVTHPTGSLDNILKAMDAAHQAKIPVVVIQHESARAGSPVFQKESEGWKLHPEVARRPMDHRVEKRCPGSFTGTDLEPWLRERGINAVVISGYMTQMCCDATARQAFHRGFRVEFLSDATGTLALKNEAGAVRDEELHRAILVTQAMVFSKVLTTEAWAREIGAAQG